MILALRTRADFLFVGEIRDSSTAAQVIQASINGHLIISTGHAGSVTQGIERISALAQPLLNNARELLSKGLVAVLHQSLSSGNEGSRRLTLQSLLFTGNDGPRILHKLIAYIPQRRRLRERWVAAMQRDGVPMRVIDGEVDPISGAHMVERYHQLVPNADSVLLANIGHYPQIEAPVLVLKHYLEFRERMGQPASCVAYS